MYPACDQDFSYVLNLTKRLNGKAIFSAERVQNEKLHSLKHECQRDMFVYYTLHPLNYMDLSDFPPLQLQLVNTAQHVYLGAKHHLVTKWKDLMILCMYITISHLPLVIKLPYCDFGKWIILLANLIKCL
ncbi:hypothetical protein GDO81_010225 [Engystomops pustulosus]|uniref:Uncharacterized protein n=1 Tax=Engystomops pustulosus TaxID=76066 RepID=A0AAV7BXZ4_ENGPU|nr:hypothetical protein GDO81_010225 [Engystomops pustulosus]